MTSRSLDRLEYTSLGDRMLLLLAMRTALAIIVMAWSAWRPDLLGMSLPILGATTVGYLGLSVLGELARRWFPRRSLLILSVTLLIDGVFLALASYATGSTQSPIRFLTYLHLVGVSLLASYRTGLKVALWHSLLLFVVLYGQAAELMPAVDVVPGSADRVRSNAGPQRHLVLAVRPRDLDLLGDERARAQEPPRRSAVARGHRRPTRCRHRPGSPVRSSCSTGSPSGSASSVAWSSGRPKARRSSLRRAARMKRQRGRMAPDHVIQRAWERARAAARQAPRPEAKSAPRLDVRRLPEPARGTDVRRRSRDGRDRACPSRPERAGRRAPGRERPRPALRDRRAEPPERRPPPPCPGSRGA